MQRVKRSTAVALLPAAPAGGTPGYFAQPNPQGGVPATQPGFEWYNGVQEEILGVIEDQALGADGSDLKQMAKAIKMIFQKAAAVSAAASGTVDAITANYTPEITALADNLFLIVRASGANSISAPTFTPKAASIAAKTIVKGHNQPLSVGDISGAGFRAELQYDLVLDKWVLLNPATGVSVTTVPDATTLVKGKSALATSAEVTAGTDAAKTITPAALKNATLVQASIGWGQSYTDMTASRALSTTYTNTSARPIVVSVGFTIPTTAQLTGYVAGVAVAWSNSQQSGNNTGLQFVAPPGATYSIGISAGSPTLLKWVELK